MVIKVGDLALAYHRNMIYAAKVLKIEKRKNHSTGEEEETFFVHYQGWNKKWDEWVSRERVLEDNEKHREVQKRINAGALAEAQAKKESVKKKQKEEQDSSQVKLSKVDIQMDLEELDDGNKPKIPVELPFSLKRQLVDDWERITREPHQLVPLPRKPTVSEILKQYHDYKKQKIASKQGAAITKPMRVVQEVIDGIKLYFDRALPVTLLYRYERKQWEDIRTNQKDKNPSDIYGAEHLLRLFVKLPYLLAHTSLDESEVSQLQSLLKDFISYLQKHQPEFFLHSYSSPSTKRPLDGASDDNAPSKSQKVDTEAITSKPPKSGKPKAQG